MNMALSSLLSFLGTALFSGFIIAACALTYSQFETRARHWPVFWAAALVMTLILPLLGLVFSHATLWAPTLEIETLSMHVPLDYVELATTQFLEKTPLTPFGISVSLPLILGTMYGGGLLLSGVRLFTGRRQAHHIVQQAQKEHDKNGRVYWSTKAPVSPFTMTPLGRPDRAKIIIPHQFLTTLSDQELDVILRHEAAHIERRDDEVGLILRIIGVILWFNPIGHMMFDRWKQSAEIQCDAAVTQHSHPDMRKVYAETLLKAFHITAARVRQYPTASFSNPRLRNAKMRITNIMNGPSPIFKHIGHKLALLAAFTITATTGAVIISATAHADPAAKVKVNDIDFMLTGRLTSRYGHVRDPFKTGQSKAHNGIDVAAPIGTLIHAPADGLIIEATDLFKNNPAYGTVIVIQTQDGTLTMMSHLDQYLVEKGQSVKKGDKIAKVGNSGKSTAPHVHIETVQDGERVDPMTVWPFQ